MFKYLKALEASGQDRIGDHWKELTGIQDKHPFAG